MNFDNVYMKQTELMIEILPIVMTSDKFALHGGTAINFFFKNLPRISVDIDITYLPIEERSDSLKNIEIHLLSVKEKLEKFPGIKVYGKISESIIYKLNVEREGFTVKIEPNLVKRGSIFPPIKKTLVPHAQELFNTTFSINVISKEEIYAGKFCAALQRQHPRDLFDVKQFLEEDEFTDNVRKAFIVYLCCGDAPMDEILNPNFKQIDQTFKAKFLGMNEKEIEVKDLIQARESLIKLVHNSLTAQEKNFILSIQGGDPKWDLLGLENVENLPAIRWKLINVRKMNEKKRVAITNKLRRTLKMKTS